MADPPCHAPLASAEAIRGNQKPSEAISRIAACHAPLASAAAAASVAASTSASAAAACDCASPSSGEIGRGQTRSDELRRDRAR